MGKIEIYESKITDDNINSALFLQYIEAYGFNPSNYMTIWELVQSAKGSMSQFLREYNQYLLSRKVNYNDLDALGINGAYGYFHEDGICIPKTTENDNRFLHTPVKRLYTPHSYSYPNIEEFDAIIANGTSVYMKNVANFEQDKYLGFCMDENDENLGISLERYERLLDLINRQSRSEYVFEHDKISSKGKELCLIRKK